MQARGLRLAPLLSLLLACSVLACSETSSELVPQALEPTLGDVDMADSGPTTPPMDAQVPIDAQVGVREPVLCSGAPCACDNGIDDDGDGDVDGLDSECTGPFDNDESTFSTGIPGNNMDFCHDCFWDTDSGGDDDDCRYHSDCQLGLTPTAVGNASCFDCDVSNACVDSCLPRTPSGCDCFGCCEVYLRSGETVTVLLEESCATMHAQDPERCPPCIQHGVCRNDCGECELCPGRKRKDLPESCSAGGDNEPQSACDEGEQVCDDQNPCPPDLWCQLGCCEFIPL